MNEMKLMKWILSARWPSWGRSPTSYTEKDPLRPGGRVKASTSRALTRHWDRLDRSDWTDQMKNNLDKLCRLAGNDFKLIFSRDSRRLSRLELSRPLRTQAAHVDHRQVKEEGLCLRRLHVRRVGHHERLAPMLIRSHDLCISDKVIVFQSG